MTSCSSSDISIEHGDGLCVDKNNDAPVIALPTCAVSKKSINNVDESAVIFFIDSIIHQRQI
jgi:hypothetical protein